MKRIKYLIATPVLRALDAIERALSKAALKANAAYLKIWAWTEA